MKFHLIGMNDEFPQAEHIDWGYLCVETEKLDGTTEIFKTGRRESRILAEIKATFPMFSIKNGLCLSGMTLTMFRMRWCKSMRIGTIPRSSIPMTGEALLRI